MHETELNMARERIKFCIANSGKSVSMLAGGHGSPMQTKMSRQINFNTMLTFDVIYHVLQTFPMYLPSGLFAAKAKWINPTILPLMCM